MYSLFYENFTARPYFSSMNFQDLGLAGKLVICYYSSIRSDILYRDVLAQFSDDIACVIQMPVIPYSKKVSRRRYKETLVAALNGKRFAFFVFLIVFLYCVLSWLFQNNLERLCRKKGIRHVYFESIDDNLLSLLTELQPDYILSSTTTIIGDSFIEKAAKGVLNVHEGELPKYRGSACYFWMAYNGETTARSSGILIDTGLDTGPILYQTDPVPIGGLSVFEIWKTLLLESQKIVSKFFNDFRCGEVPRSIAQANSTVSPYSFPVDADFENIRKRRLVFIRLRDIFWIIRFCIARKFHHEEV